MSTGSITRRCPGCDADIPAADTRCSHCGATSRPLTDEQIKRATVAQQLLAAPKPLPATALPPVARVIPQRVVVVDIDLHFLDIVGLIFKWSMAAIPAMIMLAIVGVIGAVIIGAILRSPK